MKERILEFLQKEHSRYLMERQEERNSNLPYFFIKSEGIVPVIKSLKENPEFAFNFLLDLTSIDWLGKKTPRFEVAYILRSPQNNHYQIQIKVPVDEGEKISSITSIFKGANWPEREVYDLMGIEFINHPFMERLIMPDNFIGHPLRKDYPLEGFGQDYLIEDLLYIHTHEDMEGSQT
jgi:NADH-quinone oxidoreductase subunit C